MKGFIIESTGAAYKIKAEDGNVYNCIMRGKFRTEQFNLTNPIAVGDRVLFKLENKNSLGVINEILPRKNYISRKSPYRKFYSQILASNINQVILIASPFVNDTNLFFIDRFLLTSEFFNVKPLIVINKIDLLTKEQKKSIQELSSDYTSLGYNIINISALEGNNFQILLNNLKNKVSLLTGRTGAGKSTIVNKLDPQINQRVREVSSKTNIGKHTTTNATMFEIKKNTYIIDTPGIQFLTPNGVKRNEISHYFPEMISIGKCKYNDCIHIKEPGCKVLEAIDKGKILKSRYRSYKKLYLSEI